MASSLNVIRAGVLLRESTILHRWKKGWFVVYGSGDFKYFESEDDYISKANVYLPTECIGIHQIQSVSEVPKGYTRKCLFSIVTHTSEWRFCAESEDDATAWILALSEARGIRDVTSGHLRVAATGGPPVRSSYTGYSDGVNYYQHAAYPTGTVPVYDANSAAYSMYHPSTLPEMPVVYRGTDGEVVVPEQVIEHPDGSRTVILGPGRELYCHCRRGYYCGCGDRSGLDAAVLGLAAGTLLWSPFMWAPFFWF